MKSSDGGSPRFRSLVPWGVALAAALGVAAVRPAAAARYHSLRVTSDVYPLASPDQMVVASLGYRAALADVIFAHLLVSYGLHFQEKRRFEFVGDYLDTVNALDPKFKDPYRFADTLLVIAPQPPRLSDYVKAREILERGVRNRPYDTDLWLVGGQYLAYLAYPYVPADVRAEWKKRGGQMLARACELASNNQNIPYNCITAASLLDTSGEREAAIESLRRLIAVNDDPEIERLALGYLGQRLDERDAEREKRRRAAFREVWQRDLPFAKKDTLLLLGPHVDVGRCAGAAHSREPGCETSFRDWFRSADPMEEKSP